MPLKSPTLRLRSGINVPDWLGMIPDGPAATIPNHSPRLVENGLFAGSSIKDRPGMQEAFEIGGPIQGFVDAGDIGAARSDLSSGPYVPVPGGGRYLYFTGIHENGLNNVLFRFDTVDYVLEEEVIGALAPANYYKTCGLVVAADDTLYAAGALVSGSSRSGVVLKLVWGSPVVVTVVVSIGGSVNESGFGLAGGGVFPGLGMYSSLVEDPNAAGSFFSAKPYRPSALPADDGKIYRNGVLDDTPTLTVEGIAASLVAFNGTVYALWGGPAAGTNVIRKRVSANNWVNLTLPTTPWSLPGNFTVANFGAYGNGAVFGGKLWVFGFYSGTGSDSKAALLSVTTGGVVTLEHFANYDKSMPVNSLVFNSILYYVLTDLFFRFAKLGTTPDGVGFDDDHSQLLIETQGHTVNGIRHASDSLWAVGIAGHYDADLDGVLDGDGSWWLLKSKGANTTSWRAAFRITDESTSTPLADLIDRDV